MGEGQPKLEQKLHWTVLEREQKVEMKQGKVVAVAEEASWLFWEPEQELFRRRRN